MPEIDGGSTAVGAVCAVWEVTALIREAADPTFEGAADFTRPCCTGSGHENGHARSTWWRRQLSLNLVAVVTVPSGRYDGGS
ncbi:hypothetical protein [Streptomyces sp. NPDC006446]|uniref:hypothetical protein n=1 Tax=Streptomyces sp. NPDC006446 TaxID=3154301 RepID=UPI0033B91693